MFDKDTIVNKLLNFCADKAIDVSNLVVIASGALVLQDVIATANDIDINVSDEKIFNLLTKIPCDSYKEWGEESVTKLRIYGELEIHWSEKPITPNPIKTVVINGITCWSLETCLDFYESKKRPKDQDKIKQLLKVRG